MSIPPLVCSTPPPPEQCEDDKDHEDFDITYNLSQEDDDEYSSEYNYGSYSGYNIFPPKSEQIENENWSSNFNENIQTRPEGTLKSDEVTENDVNLIVNDKFEDNILEDLNLKVDSDNVHSNDIVTKEYETEPDIYNNDCSDKNSTIQDQGGTDSVENVDENTIVCPEAVESATETVNDSLPFENNEPDENIETFSEDLPDITVAENVNSIEIEANVLPDTVVLENESEILENVDHSKSSNLSIDDFGDFEDFQFTSSNTPQVLPITSENPWDNNANESSEFGDFTANFDENAKETITEISNCHKNSTTEECDDDFGDFDDFKSVNNVESTEDKEETLNSNVSMLSLHSSENELQIVDSINSVLNSIFTNEISEPENDLDTKLEQFLSETWGHLIDIDIRQPYIINWNNSLGQKTLLKALCIDSRNILFGPKWNYNTPKYATNLSTAPLQPQKQVAQANVTSAESTEKVLNKEASTWIDPFTPDGQESCSSENDIAKNETMKRPTNLDVFENESSTSNKIYSSTINVQPLRHINLPDTHIFTPTDSETPRSKTIHYDSEPSSLVTQPDIETINNQPEQNISKSNSITDNDNEYWEFQDFKGPIPHVATNTVDHTADSLAVNKSLSNVPTTKAEVTYQTQILQPIKLEPIIPTLNWPDPGEVKETFDDFSDFVSSHSWNENETTTSKPDVQTIDTKLNIELDSKTNKMDDEFETFQSAPVSSIELDVTSSTKNVISNSFSPSVKENFEKKSFKVESNIVPGSSNLLVENKGSMFNNNSGSQDVTAKPISHQLNSDILLPITSSAIAPIRNQHNTVQILQPLSLESYSQINWPNPGIDLQDLSRFNPMNSLNSLKSDVSANNSKLASPAHSSANTVPNEVSDDDIWGEFVSNVPKTQQTSPKKNITFADDDEWTDFVSSPSLKPQNGLNTISLNVHTNSSMQKAVNQNKFASGSNQIQLDIPSLNYITPKSNSRGKYMEKHFQNL
ncbi:uncharacterized protein LOC124538301 isoform X2 [Vanessa cardui]|uniref:uncharacterized protein LOC124538301 isoform X2 n=1 Tax=Vanessa cardui TaxID=171605 RepID=UPI001F13DA7F|nr:uncharacterized protein LOC124538301 isoform X2 [Vanessa cardui]